MALESDTESEKDRERQDDAGDPRSENIGDDHDPNTEAAFKDDLPDGAASQETEVSEEQRQAASGEKDRKVDPDDKTPRRWTGQLMASRRRVKYKPIPFLLSPASDDNGPWHKDQAQVTNWLSLFYNLVLGSNLSAFSGSHNLQTPEKIPSYFAFYVVLVTLWTSHLHYDLRFECNDTVHRLFKGCQILLLVYIAASSGGWDLAHLASALYPDAPSPSAVSDLITHKRSRQSFLSVAIVAAAHCALLSLQYTLVTFLGRRVKRSTTSPRWSLGSLSFACIMFIVAAVIPPTSTTRANAKIALLYLGLSGILVIIGVQAFVGLQVPPREGHLSTQYGSLSITILGIGFMNCVTAFQSALAGVGDADVAYLQVFLYVGIIYFVWVFMFADFQASMDVDAAHTWVWEVIHFPLHFLIILLIASMVNAIALTSWSNGMVEAYSLFNEAINSLRPGTPLNQSDLWHTARYLGRLNLSPDFVSEYSVLLVYYGDTTVPMEERNSTMLLWSYQYLGKIVETTCSQSGVAVGSKATSLMRSLTLLGNKADITEDTANQAIALSDSIVNAVLDSVYSGVLWIYPAAGFVLILCALRSVERFRFKGLAGYVMHGFQFAGGITLCLLTLLIRGGRSAWFTGANSPEGKLRFDNQMYRLASKNMAVAIVFIIYAAVLMGSMGSMELIYYIGREKREEACEEEADDS